MLLMLLLPVATLPLPAAVFPMTLLLLLTVVVRTAIAGG